MKIFIDKKDDISLLRKLACNLRKLVVEFSHTYSFYAIAYFSMFCLKRRKRKKVLVKLNQEGRQYWIDLSQYQNLLMIQRVNLKQPVQALRSLLAAVEHAVTRI